MKKSLAILAALATIVMSEGVFFKLFHFSGGGYMILGGAVLAIAALVLALIYLLKKPGCVTTKCVSIISGIVTISAICFKMLHLPSAAVQIMIAFGILLPVTAILLAIAFARNED